MAEHNQPRAGRWRRLLLGTTLVIGIAGVAVTVGARRLLAHRYHQAALQALLIHDLQHAAKHLDRSLSWRPNDATVYLLAAQTARRLDRYTEAVRYLAEYERIHGADKISERDWFLQGVQQGEVAGHENYLRYLAERDPVQAPLIVEAMAKGYLNSFCWPVARDCLSSALQKWPGFAPYHALRGQAYAGMRQTEPALADYRQAVEDAPQYQAGRLNLALMLQELGYSREAYAHFEFLHRQAPDEAAVLLGLARCRCENHELETARQSLQTLVGLQPHFVPGLVEAGRIALYFQQPEEAEALLLRAQALAPSHLDTQQLLEACYAKQRKTGEWTAVRERLQQIHGSDLQLIHLLDQCRDEPRNVRVRFDIGQWKLQHQDEADALRWWYSSLFVDEHFLPTHEALAAYYERTGQRYWAAQHRQRASTAFSPTRAAR